MLRMYDLQILFCPYKTIKAIEDTNIGVSIEKEEKKTLE